MYTKITIYACKCTQCVVYYTRKLQNITKHYKTWRTQEMKSKEEIRKRQQEYKDKMFNKFSNEFTRKIILQKQNQMLREEIERLKANQ